MQLSAAGAAFIQSQESVSFTPYPDKNGTSIGYGHYFPSTTPPSQIPASITQAQADAYFAQDVKTAATAVNQSLTVPISQSAFDALVDYAYNRGVSNYATSTVPDQINAGNLNGAAATIRSSGLGCGTKAQATLQTRRNLEAQMLLGQATVASNAYQFPSS